MKPKQYFTHAQKSAVYQRSTAQVTKGAATRASFKASGAASGTGGA